MPSFKKPNKGGRPPKLTDELTKKVCSVMRAGAYIETAVVVNGISKAVFYQWCKLGQDKEGKRLSNKYGRFLDAVDKALEECTVRDLLNIDAAAMGEEPVYMRDAAGGIIYAKDGKPIVLKPGSKRDWSASAWRLERRHAKKWSRTEKQEHTGKDGGPIVETTMSEDDMEREIARLRAIRNAQS